MAMVWSVRAGAMAMIASAPAACAARAAEDHRQAAIHLLHHGVQVAHALLLAEEVELAHHHRPDNAVLAAAAAEVGRRPQVRGEDLVVWRVGGGQQAEDPLEMWES